MQNSGRVYILHDFVLENGRIVRKNSNDNSVEGIVNNNNNLLQATSASSSECYQLEEEKGAGEILEVPDVEDVKFSWNHESTLLFLDEYQQRYEDFRNPKMKKKKLWEQISHAMLVKGYSIDCDSLDRKMRNMRGTYKTILDNNKKKTTGRGKVHWEYYSRFFQIFAEDKTINPEHIVASMAITKPNSTTDNSKAETPSDSSNASSPSPSCEYNIGRPKRLDVYRKRQLEIEEARLEELKSQRRNTRKQSH